MAVRIDFTNVETLDTNPVPSGTYEATVQGCKPKTSSTGKPMLEWAFNIEHPDYQGRRVFTNAVLTPNALWKLKQILGGLGYSEEELGGEFDFDPADVIGLSCGVVVTQREYQGTMRNDVQRVIPIEDVAPVPQNAEELPAWAQNNGDVNFYTDDSQSTAEQDGYDWTQTLEDDEDTDATTAALNLAAEHDVDIDLIHGTGANGKITKNDVQSYIDARENASED